MKLAIISLTLQGQNVANRIAQMLEDDHTVLTIDLFHKNVKDTIEKIFSQYDCILHGVHEKSYKNILVIQNRSKKIKPVIGVV